MEKAEKPRRVDQIWSEKDLCERFDLPVAETGGRCRILSSWIREGLKCIEKSEKRFFFEQDIIDFLWEVRKEVRD